MTQLLTQNAKMKKASIKTFNFGIIAHKSERHNMLTCPFASECIDNCYAKQGAYTWSNVKEAYENRLTASLRDDFVQAMDSEIKKKKAQAVRIHDSGDFYSIKYLEKWIDIIKLNPSVQFYAYTKSIPFFKDRILPKNFIVIFSNGGKISIPENSRHSQVFESLEAMELAGYINANEDDTQAWDNNSNKIGLIFHGTKKPIFNGFIKQ
jgi:hypothetical protein